MIEVLCGRRYKSEECEINFLILWREYSCVCILQYTTVHTCTVNIWHGPRIMINFSTIIFCFADLHTRIADLFRQTFAINPHVTLVLSSNAYRLACPQHQRQNRRSVWFTLLKKIHCSVKVTRNDLCIFNESTSNVQCIFYYPLIGPFPRTFLNDNTSDRPCQTRRQLFSSVLIVIVLTALLILIFWKNYDRQNHCIKDESRICLNAFFLLSRSPSFLSQT